MQNNILLPIGPSTSAATVIVLIHNRCIRIACSRTSRLSYQPPPPPRQTIDPGNPALSIPVFSLGSVRSGTVLHFSTLRSPGSCHDSCIIIETHVSSSIRSHQRAGTSAVAVYKSSDELSSLPSLSLVSGITNRRCGCRCIKLEAIRIQNAYFFDWPYRTSLSSRKDGRVSSKAMAFDLPSSLRITNTRPQPQIPRPKTSFQRPPQNRDITPPRPVAL